ncbi:MAG: mechanosensitive ion channel domain-containing protein [Actinomycetota bacterium]
MFSDLALGVEAVAVMFAAMVVAWTARRAIRWATRRAVRRARRGRSSWRIRLDRLGDDGHGAARRLQRADAVARIFGHLITMFIVGVAALIALDLIGINPVYAVSSAGFLGFALALSGQDLIKDLIGGTRALLEDRYAVGDEVDLRIEGTDVHGVVDLVGIAAVRIRTEGGASWHAGHHTIQAVTNHSQLPSVSEIEVPGDLWSHTTPEHAGQRLAAASNEPGLTGVVFLSEVEHAVEPTVGDEPDTVRVRSNRPLTDGQRSRARQRLLDEPDA